MLNFVSLFTIKISEMENLEQKLDQLNALAANFEYEKAFDMFYDESLLDYENEDQSASSLLKHRQDMQQFLASITNKSATAVSTLVSNDITVTDWHYVYDHVQWGHQDFHEVTVQRWKDGKIIHERHHYKTEKF
jgi:hypothetical protein